jgi:hypothetical protein
MLYESVWTRAECGATNVVPTALIKYKHSKYLYTDNELPKSSTNMLSYLYVH